MIRRIEVWERLSGDHRLVGEMICEISENGRARTAFRYEDEYLERSDAFALDPVSLPLTSDSVLTERPDMFGVFEDSLPDDWGRNLLVRKHQIPRREQNLPNLLLALGSTGLGALSFIDHAQPQQPPPEISMLHLTTLVESAEQYERGEVRNSDISLLLGAGSSPGGARPKAVVFDVDCDTHYLAKFPSTRDHEDVVKIEAATLSLALKAGLVVPNTRLVRCSGKSVLLVQRFDVTPSGRRHMVSFQTLLKAHGYYQHRYQDLLAVVRKYSQDPLEDSERLYRQMVFNAVMGNTDDHLKNFWMVYDGEHGWRLSPAFDLIPDVGRRGEHVLFFDHGAYYPGRSCLESLGKRWGVRNAYGVVAQVFDAVVGWKEEFKSLGVLDKDILRFRTIDSHLQK